MLVFLYVMSSSTPDGNGGRPYIDRNIIGSTKPMQD